MRSRAPTTGRRGCTGRRARCSSPIPRRCRAAGGPRHDGDARRVDRHGAVVLTPDLLGLRRARDLLESLNADGVSPDKIDVVLNQAGGPDITAKTLAPKLIEALKARGVPFVFSTGYGEGGLPDEWRGQPTLQKPFTESAVRDALSNYDFGSANFGLKDSYFATTLSRAMPAGIAFDPNSAAANDLKLPHPVHIHCNNLGVPGNAATTLETTMLDVRIAGIAADGGEGQRPARAPIGDRAVPRRDRQPAPALRPRGRRNSGSPGADEVHQDTLRGEGEARQDRRLRSRVSSPPFHSNHRQPVRFPCF